MLGSSSLPSRWRGGANSQPTSRPRWFDRFLSPVLLSIASRACTHPIQTIVLFAFLASTTYLGLLENSLFAEPASAGVVGAADFQSLLAGSKRLYLGEDTNWKWTVEDNNVQIKTDAVGHVFLLLVILVF